MTLTRREKIIIAVGAVLISATAYVLYFLIPTINNSAAAGARLIQAQGRASQLNYMAEQAKKLEEEIKTLDSQLDARSDTLPKGISHAKMLLYLKDLTDGKAEALSISIKPELVPEGSFLLQDVTLEFRSNYAEYIAILSGLKENKLYNRATFVQAQYSPVETQTPEPTQTPEADATAGVTPASTVGTPAPAATARPVDDNVLQVHIELSFYVLAPENGEQVKEPMEATNKDRTSDLFPKD